MPPGEYHPSYVLKAQGEIDFGLPNFWRRGGWKRKGELGRTKVGRVLVPPAKYEIDWTTQY